MRNGYEDVLEIGLQDPIGDLSNAVASMIRGFKITQDEWPQMQQESPGIWKRIDEIEWYGPRTIEQTKLDMEILLKNYERLFTRRVNRRVTAA